MRASVRCDAHERERLVRLCRDITRPALANERVQCDAAGQAVLALKIPRRDGTTHLVMSPLEFMQRLAALVPRPRLLERAFGLDCPRRASCRQARPGLSSHASSQPPTAVVFAVGLLMAKAAR
jgi:hypothetical protein